MLIIASLPCLLVFGVLASQAAVENAPLESQYLKPLQEQRASSYQNQQALPYQSCAPQETALCSKPQRQLSPKNYATHSFLGIQNAWIGKKIAFDDSKPAWSGSLRQLEKNIFPTRVYLNASNFRAIQATTLTASSYPTKQFYPDAKAQGGIDHDFQQALQKAKSPQEVRGILERK